MLGELRTEIRIIRVLGPPMLVFVFAEQSRPCVVCLLCCDCVDCVDCGVVDLLSPESCTCHGCVES